MPFFFLAVKFLIQNQNTFWGYVFFSYIDAIKTKLFKYTTFYSIDQMDLMRKKKIVSFSLVILTTLCIVFGKCCACRIIVFLPSKWFFLFCSSEFHVKSNIQKNVCLRYPMLSFIQESRSYTHCNLNWKCAGCIR